MLYKEFKELKLSALGMGTVRLPLTSENSADVDVPAVDRIIDAAMEHGINYFDLGWDYHGGRAEEIVCQSLLRYPRESYHLAAKFPGYYPDLLDKVDEVFEEQLRHCGVEYFDFYLLHNVCEGNIDAYLDPKYGIIDYLLRQKEAGRIRHFGMSSHAALPALEQFLDAAGEHIEFCQIQLNWLDWEFQNAKGKVELLNQRKIPVWVMEPLRGGRLLGKLFPEELETLHKLRPDETAYAFGMRFLQDIPGVTMVLSGLSNVEQVVENTRTFSEEKPLNEEEKGALAAIAKDLTKRFVLPCTACRYCTSHCPQELNIPALLELYNEQCFTGGGFIAPRAMMALPEEKRATACIGCRSCEAFCPQGIKISEAMADFSRKTEEFFKNQ